MVVVCVVQVFFQHLGQKGRLEESECIRFDKSGKCLEVSLDVFTPNKVFKKAN